MKYMPGYLQADLAERSYASSPGLYDCITNALPPDFSMPALHTMQELWQCAELGNARMVLHLLDHGASPLGQFAMYPACRASHLDVALLLIRQGVSPLSINLHKAASIPHYLKMTELPLRHGASPNVGSGPIRRLWHTRRPNPYDVHQFNNNDTINTD